MPSEANTYPAITLHQPWATLIAEGIKTVETRTHNRFKCLEGREIAIHAGKTWDATGAHDVNMRGYVQGLLRPGGHVFGAVLCRAKVTMAGPLKPDMERAACCPTEGLFGLTLQVTEVYDPPIPATGRQGIWQWTEPEMVSEIEVRWPESGKSRVVPFALARDTEEYVGRLLRSHPAINQITITRRRVQKGSL